MYNPYITKRLLSDVPIFSMQQEVREECTWAPRAIKRLLRAVIRYWPKYQQVNIRFIPTYSTNLGHFAFILAHKNSFQPHKDGNFKVCQTEERLRIGINLNNSRLEEVTIHFLVEHKRFCLVAGKRWTVAVLRWPAGQTAILSCTEFTGK